MTISLAFPLPEDEYPTAPITTHLPLFSCPYAGGKPKWLNPEKLPSVAPCGKCGGRMGFLCQIYAPKDTETESLQGGGGKNAYHRTLYVFVCRSPSCNGIAGSSTLKIYRAQLPKENGYYPGETTGAKREDCLCLPADFRLNTCATCGVLATKRCPKQDKFFCGRQCQLERIRAERGNGGKGFWKEVLMEIEGEGGWSSGSDDSDDEGEGGHGCIDVVASSSRTCSVSGQERERRAKYVANLCEKLTASSDSLEESHLASSLDSSINSEAVSNILSPYTPTTPEKILRFLDAVKLTADDVLLDLGSGDGRVCVSAAHEIGCLTRGVDVVPECVERAREIAEEENLGSRCEFLVGDVTDVVTPDSTFDGSVSDEMAGVADARLVEGVTVVYIYCFPTLLAKMGRFMRALFRNKSVRAVALETYHVTDQVAEEWGAEVQQRGEGSMEGLLLLKPRKLEGKKGSGKDGSRKKKKKKKKIADNGDENVSGARDDDDGIDDDTLEQPEMNKITGATGLTDETTISFLTRIDATGPEQCLRYSSPWSNDAILWTSSHGKLNNFDDVPPCKNCGGKRVFEFQVMPQLLHYLKVDENIQKGDLLKGLKENDDGTAAAGGAVDFGTVCVFTCEKSCGGADGYQEEWAWRQPPNLKDEEPEPPDGR